MLGASVVAVGMIEGVAEGTAAVTKVFAGALSDYFRRRKTLIVLGYALAALAKPLFPLATSASWILAGRFIDRMSKGIRDAPRDGRRYHCANSTRSSIRLAAGTRLGRCCARASACRAADVILLRRDPRGDVGSGYPGGVGRVTCSFSSA